MLEVQAIIKRQSCHHIETSQLICPTNQLTGFYLMATLAFNELISNQKFPTVLINIDLNRCQTFRKIINVWCRFTL